MVEVSSQSEDDGGQQCIISVQCHSMGVSLSRSRLQPPRQSCGSPQRRSWSLWCWGLRSCRLNCLPPGKCWTCRGGQPWMGGCHTVIQWRSESRRTHTHLWIIDEHAWVQMEQNAERDGVVQRIPNQSSSNSRVSINNFFFFTDFGAQQWLKP